MTSDPKEAGLKSAEQSMMGRRRVLSGVGGVGPVCLLAQLSNQSPGHTDQRAGPLLIGCWTTELCARVCICLYVCVLPWR